LAPNFSRRRVRRGKGAGEEPCGSTQRLQRTTPGAPYTHGLQRVVRCTLSVTIVHTVLYSCCSHAVVMPMRCLLLSFILYCAHAVVMLVTCLLLSFMLCCTHAVLMLYSCCTHAVTHAVLLLYSCCTYTVLQVLSLHCTTNMPCHTCTHPPSESSVASPAHGCVQYGV
jgi:hypothetical protein